MAYKDWLPAIWKQSSEGESPITALRKQIDEVFDDFDKSIFHRGSSVRVRSNVSETDSEVCFTAELPGLSEKDVDVSVTGDRITIKGEMKSETEEKKDDEGREFYRVERMSGAFQRSIQFPFEIDPDKVTAKVKDGVLTVTIPKPQEAVEKTQKIAVAKGT